MCPVKIAPLFFMSVLEMDEGGYVDAFFLLVILEKVENYNFITIYPFLTLVKIAPPRILLRQIWTILYDFCVK